MIIWVAPGFGTKSMLYFDQVAGRGTVIAATYAIGRWLLPLIAAEILDEETIAKTTGFYKRLNGS